MRSYIFAFRFFNYETEHPNLGGTQTYLTELAEVLYSQGYDVHILDEKQGFSNRPQTGTFNHFTVEEFFYGYNLNKSFHSYYKTYTDDETLFIIGDDEQAIYPKGLKNVISIQHGIGWDYERTTGKKSLPYIFPIYKLIICLKKVFNFYKGSNYVCVDYNYFNWLRTLYYIPKDRFFRVIPNFSSAQFSRQDIEKKLDAVEDLKSSNIVFARRLQWYRGAIIWAKVIKRLSSEYPLLKFTIAGEGSCKKDMCNILKDIPNITFTKFNAEHSVEFHKNFQIAVIPTIYSEGTSLSACEAMAAGCLPVVSCVGGLANIVIDKFNGRLFYPDEEELYQTVKEVLEMDIGEYKRMVWRAYESTTTTFSRKMWADKWIKVIKTIMSSK